MITKTKIPPKPVTVTLFVALFAGVLLSCGPTQARDEHEYPGDLHQLCHPHTRDRAANTLLTWLRNKLAYCQEHRDEAVSITVAKFLNRCRDGFLRDNAGVILSNPMYYLVRAAKLNVLTIKADEERYDPLPEDMCIATGEDDPASAFMDRLAAATAAELRDLRERDPKKSWAIIRFLLWNELPAWRIPILFETPTSKVRSILADFRKSVRERMLTSQAPENDRKIVESITAPPSEEEMQEFRITVTKQVDGSFTYGRHQTERPIEIREVLRHSDAPITALGEQRGRVLRVALPEGLRGAPIYVGRPILLVPEPIGTPLHRFVIVSAKYEKGEGSGNLILSGSALESWTESPARDIPYIKTDDHLGFAIDQLEATVKGVDPIIAQDAIFALKGPLVVLRPSPQHPVRIGAETLRSGVVWGGFKEMLEMAMNTFVPLTGTPDFVFDPDVSACNGIFRVSDTERRKSIEDAIRRQQVNRPSVDTLRGEEIYDDHYHPIHIDGVEQEVISKIRDSLRPDRGRRE